MELREKLARYPGEEDDRTMLCHVYDVLERGRLRNQLAATEFLSEREQALIRQLFIGCELRFFGGAEQCERQVCCYLPDYLDALPEDGPIAAIRAEFSPQDKLTHRDLLGALMGSGIRRQTVGDIFVAEGRCDFFVTRAIAPYVVQNLLSAGRAHLSVREIALQEVQIPEAKTELRRDTVASLRFDALCAAVFRLSREKAVQAIAAKKASLNGLPCEKPDRAVNEGDVISIRGLGKAALEEVSGNTKKGRIAVQIRRYL